MTRKSNWAAKEIVNDTRIDHDNWRVRAVAERLHRNESIDKHRDIAADVCVYCALRATHAVRELHRLNTGVGV